MQVTYQSPNYKPEDVTGVYVRCEGRKGSYKFKVFETETCKQRGAFFGKPGYGYTLREYITNGDELPQEIKDKCIQSKTTERLS